MKRGRLSQTLWNMRPFPEELRDKALFAKFREVIKDELTRTKYEQRTILLGAGEVPQYSYLVERGLLRYYYIDSRTGRQSTMFFHGKNMVSVPIISYYCRTRCNSYIEAMQGTILLALSYEQAKNLLIRFPGAEMYIDLLMEASIEYYAKSIDKVRTCSTWERYLKLLEEYPDIEQQVPLEYIASFLGITGPWLKKLIRRSGHPSNQKKS